MGRGRLLKTKLKEAKKFLEIREKTRWKLTLKKPLAVSAREHIGKMLDNTSLTEVIDIVTALGLTFSVLTIAKTTYGNLFATFAENVTGFTRPFSDVVPVKEFVAPLLRTGVERPIIGGKQVTWQEILVAFTISWLVVKYGGDLISLGLKTVVGNIMGGLT